MDNQNLINLPAGGPKRLLTRKNIFIALGAIVILEIIWAGWTLFRPIPPPPSSIPRPVSQKPTVLSLEAPQTNLKVGEKVTVSIKLSSAKKTDGTDLILMFDPKILSVQTTTAGQPVIGGTIYSDYPSNVLDVESGRVIVSGITSTSGGVLAEGLFGSLILVAKAPGQAKVWLQFSPGSTTDSNVIESGTGKDVLEKVANLELIISQ